MNRSQYPRRRLDKIDRIIIAMLFENARIKFCDIADRIGMSVPTVTDRLSKILDAGAIRGYSAVIDPAVFGLGIAAHIRMCAMPGLAAKLAELIFESPQIVAADLVTGEGCYLAKAIVADLAELEALLTRLEEFSSAEAFVILSQVLAKRLPNI